MNHVRESRGLTRSCFYREPDGTNIVIRFVTLLLLFGGGWFARRLLYFSGDDRQDFFLLCSKSDLISKFRFTINYTCHCDYNSGYCMIFEFTNVHV